MNCSPKSIHLSFIYHYYKDKTSCYYKTDVFSKTYDFHFDIFLNIKIWNVHKEFGINFRYLKGEKRIYMKHKCFNTTRAIEEQHDNLNRYLYLEKSWLISLVLEFLTALDSLLHKTISWLRYISFLIVFLKIKKRYEILQRKLFDLLMSFIWWVNRVPVCFALNRFNKSFIKLLKGFLLQFFVKQFSLYTSESLSSID